MKYLLDTDICIYIIKKRPQKVFEKFKDFKLGQICISSITYAELCYGMQNSTKPTENTKTLNKFLGPIEILDYPAQAAIEYGSLRTFLKRAGKPIDPNDMLIASHALHLGCTLVTNNIREFNRIPGIDCETWA